MMLIYISISALAGAKDKTLYTIYQHISKELKQQTKMTHLYLSNQNYIVLCQNKKTPNIFKLNTS